MINDFDPNVHLDNMGKPGGDTNEPSGANDDAVFEDAEAEIVESVGVYEVKVQRISGARGKVAIPYSTEDGTAKEGVHYEAVEGELMYTNEETE